MNKIAIIALFVGGMAAGMLCRCGGRNEPSHISTQTITIRDTVYISVSKPRTVERRTVDTIYISPDTLMAGEKIALPVEQKLYEGPEYTAWVSGYNARLDSLRIMRLNTTVTSIRTNGVQSPAKRLNIGLQAGYGLTPRGLQPYLGIGVSYKIM